METPEGADLLSEWAVDASDAADSELQLLVAIPDDDAALQGAPEAPRRSRKKHRATYLRTKVRSSTIELNGEEDVRLSSKFST